MPGRLFDILHIFLTISIFFHPTENIFSIPRQHAYPLLLFLILFRSLLNKQKFSGIIAWSNISLLAGLVLALYSFAATHYWAIRYVIAIGWLLNWLVILVNGGRMPVEASALLKRKRNLAPDNPLYFREAASTRLKVLDDRIYNSFLSEKIISIGDVLIRLGAIIVFMQVFIF